MKNAVLGLMRRLITFFFPNVMSKIIWFSFKEALGWDLTTNEMQDIFEYWIPLVVEINMSNFYFDYRPLGFMNSKNKMAIEKQLPKTSKGVFNNKISGFFCRSSASSYESKIPGS